MQKENVLAGKVSGRNLTNAEKIDSSKIKSDGVQFNDRMVFLPFHFSDIDLNIYVYDLPPVFNQDIINASKFKLSGCADLAEAGYGRLVYNNNDLYVHNTWQFSLEVIMHNKMLQSPYRTNDYSKASLFYIPFYSGISCLVKMGRNYSKINQHKVMTKLLLYLEQHPSNAFKTGLPHVMGLSKIEKEQSTYSCPILRHGGFTPVYFVGIERSSIGPSDSVGGSQIHPLIIVPYPSFGHLKDYIFKSEHSYSMHPGNRTISIFMAAGIRKTNQLRTAIQKEFEQHKTTQSYRNFNGPKIHRQVTKAWLLTSDCIINPEYIIEWMQNSLFCLQPPGDSPTRKSFFDSVIAGCIPVLFVSQYKVFYPFEKYLNYSSFTVALDQSDILVYNKTVEELLLPLIDNHSEIVRKQTNLQKVARYLQYGVYTDQTEQSNDAMIFLYDQLRVVLEKSFLTGV